MTQMKRTIWDAILAITIASLLGWGVWTTCQIFAQEKDQAVNKENNTAIRQSVEEVKQEVKDLKKEVKTDLEKLRETVGTNQNKMMEILLDIKQNTKSKK